MTQIRIWDSAKRYMGQRSTERFRIMYDTPNEGLKHIAIRDFNGNLKCCDDKQISPGFIFRFDKNLASVYNTDSRGNRIGSPFYENQEARNIVVEDWAQSNAKETVAAMLTKDPTKPAVWDNFPDITYARPREIVLENVYFLDDPDDPRKHIAVTAITERRFLTEADLTYVKIGLKDPKDPKFKLNYVSDMTLTVVIPEKPAAPEDEIKETEKTFNISKLLIVLKFEHFSDINDSGEVVEADLVTIYDGSPDFNKPIYDRKKYTRIVIEEQFSNEPEKEGVLTDTNIDYIQLESGGDLLATQPMTLDTRRLMIEKYDIAYDRQHPQARVYPNLEIKPMADHGFQIVESIQSFESIATVQTGPSGPDLHTVAEIGTNTKDSFGILKIYADKVGGGGRTETTFKEEMKIRNYASGKKSEMSFELNNTASEAISNQEVTFYVRINQFKTSEPDTISIKTLGPRHQDGKGKSWYIHQIMTDGSNKMNFQIESPHPKNNDYRQNQLFEIGKSIVGQWIGIKCINFLINGGNDRHIETWIDFPVEDIKNPPNNWKKYIKINSISNFKEKFLKPTGKLTTLRIDGVINDSRPDYNYQSVREINADAAIVDSPLTDQIQKFDPHNLFPEQGPLIGPDNNMFDPDNHNIKLLYKITGRFVPIERETDNENGKRYNVNHRFPNYMMMGYFKTGKGQEQIEMKTDGPNHSGCKRGDQCCWTEVDLLMENKVLKIKDKNKKQKSTRSFNAGDMYISSEFPHPVNHPPPKDFVPPNVGQSLREKWIGFAVVAKTEGEFRKIEGWCDPDPFTDPSNPESTLKNGWQKYAEALDTGQITNQRLARRTIPVDYNKGLEAEIRMHKARSGDTQIKWARVYELDIK